METFQADPQYSQPNVILNTIFNDFEDFSSSTKAWDLDFRQLDRGSFSAEMKQAFIGSTQFCHLKLNRLMEQLGNPPKDLFTFAILADPIPFIWHKQIMPDYFIMIYAPGSEIDCVAHPGFNVFTFSLTETHFADVLHSLELPEPQRVLGNNNVITCSRTVWERLNQIFHRLDQILFSNPAGGYNSHIYQQLEYELLCLIITPFTSEQPLKPRSNSLRNNRSLNRVLQYIKINKREFLTVKDLCRIAGVTERALEYTFARNFGVSPRTYLKAFRLHYVRRELRKADPVKTKVTDVANSWGFWHMGKFAANYRSFFGELPSGTLRK
jgi:AraC family ethanolamine operon transcriptional activator